AQQPRRAGDQHAQDALAPGAQVPHIRLRPAGPPTGRSEYAVQERGESAALAQSHGPWHRDGLLPPRLQVPWLVAFLPYHPLTFSWNWRLRGLTARYRLPMLDFSVAQGQNHLRGG